MTIPVSPLRYPGGKAFLARHIGDLLEAQHLTGCSFYEPYLGGASVSLDLLGRGCISRAIWVERDPLIFAFWHSVLFESDSLCAAIENLEISLETWHEFQRYRDVKNPKNEKYRLLELGIAGLFFNRTNFSGILRAGPIGGQSQSSKYRIDCRFNKTRIIEQIYRVAAINNLIELHYGDALVFMRNNAENISTGFNFVYLDPPYYSQGKHLYRYFYEDVHHIELANFIGEQGYPWMISYDNHPRIKSLYARNNIQPVYWDYRVRSSRRATELLISNMEIFSLNYLDSIVEGSKSLCLRN